MTAAINQLQKNIMRRIYYAYFVRLSTHTVTLHTVALLGLGYVLARLVHVAAVWRNLSQVEVGHLSRFLVAMVTHADVPTLIVSGLVIMTLLSLQWRLLWLQQHVIATA